MVFELFYQDKNTVFILISRIVYHLILEQIYNIIILT
ncbi:MAG: hypothetical protein EZS26_002014 [Candidatus Ordinivivax streblomastigis]|uniref:Uncharacterized protein n=1 Tax=Candidatus Ordinivivax streblomastigis TaxID=2540710 RepID=A0A5M8P0B8_9BACT|nr:MAG: hypothetical protein EZS26_002014 [Candidatus Ordinivivax streblomastigis]